MHVAVLLPILALLYPCAGQRTYCLPCQPCWPSMDQIQSFNQSLSGFAIQPCEVEKFQKASIVYNHRLYRFPGIIVEPANTGDVQKALAFAQDHNIQLSIKSSGHCFLGRSAVYGSLNLNMRSMRSLRVNMNDTLSETGATITAESGANWIEIYQKVNEYGRVVNGGSCPMVAVGGYTVGGGHGPMSRSIGLGVDNAVAFEIVTADRKLRRCTAVGPSCVIINDDGSEEADPNGADLFWAVRGGGQSFGVIINFTLKLHTPPPQLVHLLLTWPIKSDLFGDVGKRALNFYNAFVQQMPRKWGGYMLINNADAEGYKGAITLSLLHYGPWEEAYPSIEPLLSVEAEAQLLNFMTNYTTFYDYTVNVDDYNPGRLYMIGRFIQPSDLGENFTALMTEDLLNMQTGAGCTFIHIGGKVSETPRNDSAITAGFRNGIFSLACASGWQSEYLDDVNIASLKSFSKEFYKFGKNVYINEADTDLDNWQDEFWGENYNRLLQIKQVYDPQHWFTCKKCVGYGAE